VSRAAELRASFDAAFARPAARERAAARSLLVAISVAGEPYALRSLDIRGLEAPRRVTPAPGGAEGLLGLAGVRGTVVPIYDLAALVGRDAGTDADEAWIALLETPGGALVGVAFGSLDGTIAGTAAASSDVASGEDGLVAAVVGQGASARPLLSGPALVAEIRRRAGIGSRQPRGEG
jgi:chemotaxis signal transduction protein